MASWWAVALLPPRAQEFFFLKNFAQAAYSVLLPELSDIRRHVGRSTSGDLLFKFTDLLRTS